MIQRSGVGDSVLVTDGQGRLAGVLTERDIFGRLVGEPVDLRRPVETMMNREPRTFRIDDTVHDAIALMASGVYRNVPIVDDDGRVVGHRPPGRHPAATWPRRSPRSSSTCLPDRTSG